MRKVGLLAALAALTMLFCSCANLTADGGAGPSSHLSEILQRGELIVGTSGNMPPLNMAAKNGEVIGLEMDIVRMMADGMGVTLKIKTVPFHELLPNLESGNLDLVISGMTITPKRNLSFAFAGPYMASGKSFLAKIETLANAKDTAVANSPSTVLTALKGSTSEEFVKMVIPKAQLITTDTYDQAIQLVREDKAHAMVADFPICAVAVFRFPEAGFISVHTPLTYEPYGIALPPGDAHLLNWVENFLQTLEDGETLDFLYERWFGNGDWIPMVW